MRSIVNEFGQVVAQINDDGRLVDERHVHRVRNFAQQHRPLFWQDTGEHVKLETLGRRNLCASADGYLATPRRRAAPGHQVAAPINRKHTSNRTDQPDSTTI